MEMLSEQAVQELFKGEVLTEGKLTRSKLYFDEFVALEYDSARTQKIIDDFIEDFEVRGLKAYLHQLYMLSNLDKPLGVIKNIKFTLSKANRMSFYTHKRQVLQQIKYAESWIRKIEGSNYDAVKDAEATLKAVEEEVVHDIQEVQYVALQSEQSPKNESFIDFILRKLEKEQMLGGAGDIIGLIIRGIRGIFSMVGTIIEVAGPALTAIAAIAFAIITILRFLFGM